ncbi:MAG: DNA polymerase III subunit delta [Candidatus Rokuibacteriota bacterium]|nr:MAG: DNA polymerase III subunit delta [Candidatus Rokubacteria bacterium]
MDYAALLRDIERHRIPAVALLHGPESLLLDDALFLISRALFADPSSAALDREVLDGRETSAETVARSALTLPFLAPRRLVVVRRAEALPARNNETLVQYLGAPSPSTCLLLLAAESLRADRNRKTDHWLLQAMPGGAAIELSPPRGAALERELQRRAGLDGLEVDDEAARLLVQFVGDDLALLLAEAHKAALARGADNRRVGVAEVGAVVGEHRVSELFELTRAIERGERGRALALLDQLLRAGEEPLRILGLLTTDLRTAWTVKEWAARGLPVDQIARRLRRPPPVVEKLLSRISGLPARELARRLQRCWEVELRIKSGGKPSAEMTVMIADLC